MKFNQNDTNNPKIPKLYIFSGLQDWFKLAKVHEKQVIVYQIKDFKQIIISNTFLCSMSFKQLDGFHRRFHMVIKKQSFHGQKHKCMTTIIMEKQ